MKNNKSHKASHETWQLTLWPWSFTVQYIYSTSWITNCGTSMFVKKKQPIWIFIIMIIWGRQCIYKALWKEGRSRSHTYIHKVNSHFFLSFYPLHSQHFFVLFCLNFVYTNTVQQKLDFFLLLYIIITPFFNVSLSGCLFFSQIWISWDLGLPNIPCCWV